MKSFGTFDRWAKRTICTRLSTLSRGEILIEDSEGSQRLGQAENLYAELKVHDPAFFRHSLLGGTLSVAESYLTGEWDCDDLTSLFRIFIRNTDAADKLDSRLSWLLGWSHRFFHWWHANSISGSKKNIHAHYDLGNDFFKLWLDETMAYSCGVFSDLDASMGQASTEKFDRVCRRLRLTPSDHVLEIGTGWGGFAIHAAGRYGCRVTTTTISKEQIDVARESVENAGLSDRVTLMQQDYRDLTGQYDKLVSIEMIEAVGHQYLESYFRQCGRLLKPDGSFMLQAIIMPERRYAQYLRSVDFIQRYVFPGGCLPSVAAILDAVGRSSDLRLVHVEDFAPHYAETLRRWRNGFHSQIDEVKRLGYPERFLRLWDYYLCYCEAVFEERHISVLQLQFDKPMCRRDAIPARHTASTAFHHDNSGYSSRVSQAADCVSST
jgi:cyclopropane-fatty-acyl-phospholipid synthase